MYLSAYFLTAALAANAPNTQNIPTPLTQPIGYFVGQITARGCTSIAQEALIVEQLPTLRLTCLGSNKNPVPDRFGVTHVYLEPALMTGIRETYYNAQYQRILCLDGLWEQTEIHAYTYTPDSFSTPDGYTRNRMTGNAITLMQEYQETHYQSVYTYMANDQPQNVDITYPTQRKVFAKYFYEPDQPVWRDFSVHPQSAQPAPTIPQSTIVWMTPPAHLVLRPERGYAQQITTIIQQLPQNTKLPVTHSFNPLQFLIKQSLQDAKAQTDLQLEQTTTQTFLDAQGNAVIPAEYGFATKIMHIRTHLDRNVFSSNDVLEESILMVFGDHCFYNSHNKNKTNNINNNLHIPSPAGRGSVGYACAFQKQSLRVPAVGQFAQNQNQQDPNKQSAPMILTPPVTVYEEKYDARYQCIP